MSIYTNTVTNPYGVAQANSATGRHSGVDFAGNVGDPVGAAAGGTVAFAGWSGSYGMCVVLQHPDGTFTRYAHLSQITVAPGSVVNGGTVIGKVGSTGNSTGPHLHFEVRQGDKWGPTMNPQAWLAGRGVDALTGSPSAVWTDQGVQKIRTTTYTPFTEQEGGLPGGEPVVGASTGSRGAPVVDTGMQPVGSVTGSRGGGAVGSTGPAMGKVGFEEKVTGITGGWTAGSAPGGAPGGGSGSLYDLALQAGFSPQEARIAAAIAMGESSGNPQAHNTVGADNSYGLMQMNLRYDQAEIRRRMASWGISDPKQLFDPLTNMRAAYALYKEQGWGAWSVYTSGKYRNYL